MHPRCYLSFTHVQWYREDFWVRAQKYTRKFSDREARIQNWSTAFILIKYLGCFCLLLYLSEGKKGWGAFVIVLQSAPKTSSPKPQSCKNWFGLWIKIAKTNLLNQIGKFCWNAFRASLSKGFCHRLFWSKVCLAHLTENLNICVQI